MSNTLSLTLPVELYSSKNHRKIIRRGGKPMTVKSDRAQANYNAMLTLLADARRKKRWRRMLLGKEYPLHLQVKIYRKTHQPFDYTNITQNLFDALQAADYLPDDNMNYLVPSFVPYEKDKQNPRVEITVL